MSRKIKRVPVHLDPGPEVDLSAEEIAAILRGADEMIGKGGRNLLAKLLKGSKDKKILELGLQECPVYGYYHNLTLKEIGHKVDWMIEVDYLKIEYDYRLPVLIFLPAGGKLKTDLRAGSVRRFM